MSKLLIIITCFFYSIGLVSAAEELIFPEATNSANLSATYSANLIDPVAKQSIQEKKDKDLTETTGNKTDLLATYLLAQPEEKTTWYNFMQNCIRKAVNRGLPSNLIVLLILFPLVAAVIAFSRHVIGLRGFGIYTPAVLSVAFVSTGILLGMAVFLVIVIVSVLLQKLFKKINLAHLPKSALILWGVCASMILFLIGMAYFKIDAFFSLSIFPLLILISLSENFTSTQLFSTTKEAAKLTFETLILAIVAAFIIGNNTLQRFVILNPEIALLATLVLCILIGRYNGLRLLELVRFKNIIKKG